MLDTVKFAVLFHSEYVQHQRGGVPIHMLSRAGAGAEYAVRWVHMCSVSMGRDR
jgi:hypothetical protein